mmetsp:Transcript_37028/g.87149  ORF Transcript_37028/g.87149 Transcript_37028/m.87149 type:complete len:92 (-) Transcript_37028:421-696(-)
MGIVFAADFNHGKTREKGSSETTEDKDTRVRSSYTVMDKDETYNENLLGPNLTIVLFGIMPWLHRFSFSCSVASDVLSQNHQATGEASGFS